MADNTTQDGTDTIVTLEVSYSGDTAKIQGVAPFGVTGTEGAYTAALIGGDATNGLDVDVTRVTGTVTVGGVAAEDAAASGSPVLVGGRYDSSARSLETGDVGAIALSPEGYVLVEAVGAAIDDTTTNTSGTSEGSPIMAVATPTDGSVDANDFGMLAMSLDRRLHVDAQIVGQDAGLTVDLGSNNDVTVTSGNITADTELPTAAALADNTANPTAPAVGAFGMVWDGSMWDRAPGTAADGQLVNLGSNNDVTIASVTPDLMLGTDFSTVLGTASLILATQADDVANTSDGLQTSSFGYAFDGTTWDRMRGDATNGLLVNLGSNNDVTLGAALPAGTNNIGDVDVLSVAAGANLIGDVGISGARTSGGTTLYKNIDVDESEDQVKATGGQVYWVHAINMNAATRYLKFYNATAASVTVGTTVPDLTFPVPPNSTTGGGFVLSVPNGIAFSTAITIAATTGVADNDSGAPGANEVIVNLGYA